MLKILKGSITEVNVDVIVNAANSLGYMGGGVAGYIKRVGGKEIEDEAVRKGPTPIGKAVLTTSGRLSFKGVIHAPTMERPAQRIPDENVYKATKAALELADEEFQSIAIPGMGTGVGGVEHRIAARRMIEAYKDSLPFKNLKLVVFVDIDDRMVEAWKGAARELGIEFE